jgi:hypothetical protein
LIAAIFTGILPGHFLPAEGIAMKALGDAFIKLVRMITSPIILHGGDGHCEHARHAQSRARGPQGEGIDGGDRRRIHHAGRESFGGADRICRAGQSPPYLPRPFSQGITNAKSFSSLNSLCIGDI